VIVSNSMVLDMIVVELYVWYVKVWFYEHTTRFGKQDKKRYPRMASWDKVDHGGRYDANLLLKDITEDEVTHNIHIGRELMCVLWYDIVVDHYVRCGQVIPVLYPRDDELVHRTVTQFMCTDEFSDYIDDEEVCE